MTSRNRNLGILGIVVALLIASAVVIATKPTKLGLDLRGGTELVYQGRPTPQVPTVTPQAVDDAIDTIRKRTNSLGVTETEIQRSGRDQISVGLPDVQNAQRAIAQVGTTAQLQFYDWEPNVLGRGPDSPYAGTKALFQATEEASKQKPKAEATDVAPGSDETPAEADASNDSASTPRFYLFGPDQIPIGPDGQPLRTGDYDPGGTCEEVLSDFDSEPGDRARVRQGHGVSGGAQGARLRWPAGRLSGDRGAQGHRGGGGRARREPAAADQALLRDRGRHGAERHRHQEPEGGHRPEQPARGDDGVHRQGPRGVRARDQADRRARLQDHPSAGHPARADLPALRDHARQPHRLAGDDRLRLEPRGHRRAHGRADREHRELPGDQRPRGEPADRRAADRAQADLEHAGVGHARPAGARPGPARRWRGPGAHDPLPARLLPRARAWWPQRRC